MSQTLVVSPFLRVLVHRLKSLADDDHPTASSLELPSLVGILKGFAEIFEAEEEMVTREDRELENKMHRHLLELVFEFDDLIDEMQLELQLHLPRRGVSLCFNPFSKESKFATALQHRLRTLVGIIAHDYGRVTSSSLSYGNLTSVSQGTKPHPYLGSGSHIIGREIDKIRIIESILDVEADSVKLCAIVGMGGIGKTSVAQLIYNDPSVCSKFDIRLWVDVAQEGDMFGVFVQMAMQAMGFDADLMSTLEEMQMELNRLLSKKSVFLVLDDVWSSDLLASLFSYLPVFSSKGSAVILTSRIQGVCYPLSIEAYEHMLSPLTLDKSYQLFNKYAFPSIGIETIQPEFEPIAKEIVSGCKGHPMVLKMVGTYLYNKDTLQQWAEILQSLTLRVDGDYSFSPIYGIFNFISVKLASYLKLPFYTFSLQRDSSVEESICLWMALGFLSSDDPNQQLESIGRRYLTELAESALCHDVEYAPGGAVKAIKLHDLVYDMARKEAREQGFFNRFDSSQETRYLIPNSVKDMEFPKKANKKMRLFMLHTREQVSAQKVREILSCFKCLRVLGLGGCDIEMLPDSIGELKHLRYLDVGRNVRMKSIPDSVCNLWYLQTLLLHGCDQLEALPAGIGRLQNLRYLTLTTLQESLPEEIGQLTSLRTLGLASCPRLSSLPGSIKNLKNLHTLGIADCPDMDLAASSSAEGLRGLDGIDTLLIAGIPKFECLPTDMGTPSVVLKHLLVQSCQKLTETAWINQFRSLHSLTLEGCPELSTLATDGASQFNSLVELVIRDCPRIENTTWISQFVALRSLIIDGCCNLVALDAGFSKLKSLERLEIRKCSHLSKKCASPDGENWRLIDHVQVIVLDGQILKP